MQELAEKKLALQQAEERTAQMEEVLRREPLKREAGETFFFVFFLVLEPIASANTRVCVCVFPLVPFPFPTDNSDNCIEHSGVVCATAGAPAEARRNRS